MLRFDLCKKKFQIRGGKASIFFFFKVAYKKKKKLILVIERFVVFPDFPKNAKPNDEWWLVVGKQDLIFFFFFTFWLNQVKIIFRFWRSLASNFFFSLSPKKKKKPTLRKLTYTKTPSRVFPIKKHPPNRNVLTSQEEGRK